MAAREVQRCDGAEQREVKDGHAQELWLWDICIYGIECIYGIQVYMDVKCALKLQAEKACSSVC